MKEQAYRKLRPFGQIPTNEDGDFVLFESGAIVFHIAKRHADLLPHDANGRARAITWIFAALNTVKPPIVDLGTTMHEERGKAWYEAHLAVTGRVFAPGWTRFPAGSVMPNGSTMRSGPATC
jgi:glutathione S-transferase